MNLNEKQRLQKQYEQYADDQVRDMLGDGPDAFIEGAYALLQEEAQRRGISVAAPADAVESGAPEAAADGAPAEAFVEIMVINDESDRATVIQCLDAAGILYNFLSISVAGKPLPVALMVDERRVADAVGLLQQIHPAGSIVLW